jgi:hypothetical protein
MASNTTASSKRQFRPILLLALLLPAALLMLPISLVVLAAMVPTLVARIVDTGRPPFLAVTVGCANLVGALYFVHALWNAGSGVEQVMPVLRDPIGWLAALGAAGIGWMAFIGIPVAVLSLAQVQTAMQLRRMRRDQQRLIDDWGPEVAEGKGD